MRQIDIPELIFAWQDKTQPRNLIYIFWRPFPSVNLRLHYSPSFLNCLWKWTDCSRSRYFSITWNSLCPSSLISIDWKVKDSSLIWYLVRTGYIKEWLGFEVIRFGFDPVISWTHLPQEAILITGSVCLILFSRRVWVSEVYLEESNLIDWTHSYRKR